MQDLREENVAGYMPGAGKRTIYIGDYFEKQIPGIPDVTQLPPPSPPIGQDLRLYLPILQKESSGIVEVSYYYAAGRRVAMRTNGRLNWIYGDHLGSTSTTRDLSGMVTSTASYYPWGGTRSTSGASPTDYGYTGQRQEGDIYFYNARWYDPDLGRFMQADTIVPLQAQGTQVFDRYAYVNNNPIKFVDPTGHVTCYPNGDCFVDGWKTENLLNQGSTNKCAVYSSVMGVRTILNVDIAETSLDNAWFWRKMGFDWGVPPLLQPSGINSTFRNVHATFETGNRDRIIELVSMDTPVIVTIAFLFWGHSFLANGYNSGKDQLIFADPADGKIYYEQDMVNSLRIAMFSKWPILNPHKNSLLPDDFLSTFDSLQRFTDLLGVIQPYSLTVINKSVVYHGGGMPLMPPGIGFG